MTETKRGTMARRMQALSEHASSVTAMWHDSKANQMVIDLVQAMEATYAFLVGDEAPETMVDAAIRSGRNAAEKVSEALARKAADAPLPRVVWQSGDRRIVLKEDRAEIEQRFDRDDAMGCTTSVWEWHRSVLPSDPGGKDVLAALAQLPEVRS